MTGPAAPPAVDPRPAGPLVGSVVVVGGGLAGVSTVGALRAGGFAGEITLLEAGGLPYDRPPMSKDYLAGTADREQVTLQPAAWYAEHDVRLLTGTAVVSLDLPLDLSGDLTGDGPAAVLADGTVLRADRLVLATGGRAARPPVPGADDPRVHVLRTVEDSDALRAALRPGARLLVVGAGLIGAEVASTALARGCEVTLVDPVEVPVAAAAGEQVARWLHGLHAERGAGVLTAAVEAFEPVEGGLGVRVAGEASPRTADVVLLAVGLVPETALARAAGLEVDGGVVVDAGQTTSHPAVLAVGDSARHRVDGVLQPLAEHWEAARQDGARAAATLLGQDPPTVGAAWFWTDRYGHHVEVVGRMAAATSTVVRGEVGVPPFSVFGLADGLVVGAVSVDDPMAVRAARRLVDRRVAVDPDRLADPSSDLRRLLRG